MIWLVIGSSPSALAGLERAGPGSAVTITCNAGILLVPRPTKYFVSDATACARYCEHARQAQWSGTECITLERGQRALVDRGVEWFDTFVRNGPPYEPMTLSGLWCAEHAAVEGASEVRLAGMDGYRTSDVSDYYHGRGKSHNTDLLERCVIPRMDTLVDKYPEVRWRLFGQPAFTLGARENWEVVET